MNSRKFKLFLIFHGRFPGEKAAALFAAKSAESFAELGAEVVLLVPRRFGRAKETASEYFGVKNNFRTVYLPTIDVFSAPVLKSAAFLLSALSFSLSTLFYLLFKARRADIIYSNENIPLILLSCCFPNAIYEVHDFPKKNFLNRWLFRRIKSAVITNRWKKQEIAKIFGAPEAKLLCEPNAVDVERFSGASAESVQAKLALSSDAILVGYAGALKTMGKEKGVDILLETIALLPKNFRCLIIGGSEKEIEDYKSAARALGVSDRVMFAGFVRHEAVPEYLAACDVLVAPFPNTPHYNFYMSPMKVFEYMASGKPIVVPRLNSIMEILSADSAFIFEAGDKQSLASAIKEAATNKTEAERKIAKALEIIREHTWLKRAERILDFIK